MNRQRGRRLIGRGLPRRIRLIACALIFRQFVRLWVLRALWLHQAGSFATIPLHFFMRTLRAPSDVHP
jgi:hypothetical protein